MLHIERTGLSCMFADSVWEAVHFLRSKETSESDWPEFLKKVRDPTNRVENAMLGTLGVNYNDALRLAEQGWDEGVKLMHHGLRSMIGVNASGINRWRNDVAGEQPDIYRAIGGDPRSMRRKAFSQGGKPVIHIVVNTAMQGNASDKQTLNYGIALLGLIDYLESRGKRVELDRLGVVTRDFGSGARSLQGWKVKRASESADLSAIAFAIAHPACHRKLIWAMRSFCKALRPAGSAASITRADCKLIDAEHAFMIDSVGNDGPRCKTPQDALILAGERLNKAAGEQLVNLSELRVEA